MVRVSVTVKRLLAAGIVLAFVAGSSHSGTTKDQPSTRLDLSPIERAFIAQRLASGGDQARLLVVTCPGRSRELAAWVKRHRGQVLAHDADLDLLRVRVTIDRIERLLRLQDVEAAQVEVDVDVQRLALDSGGVSSRMMAFASVQRRDRSRSSPRAYLDKANPHTGEAATESFGFKQRHPTYDGRGTVIGVIEPVDPRTPSLSHAKALDGATIPKLAGYLMLAPPPEAAGPAVATIEEAATSGWYGAWRRTVGVRRDAAGRVRFNGKSYALPQDLPESVPHEGDLRMASYWVRLAGVRIEVTLLWAVHARRLWILEGDSTDFGNGPMIRFEDASEGATVRARLPNSHATIVVAVYAPARMIGVELGSSVHGNATASAAVGHDFLGAPIDGVAPAAQLFVASGSHVSSLAFPPVPELAWLPLFRGPRVDVITSSTGHRDGRKRLPDDRLVDWRLLERLQRAHPKIFVHAAGNDGPMENIDEGPRASDNVITVGGYVPAQTWLANFGLSPSRPFTPAPFSSHGPSYDGGLKPDVLGLTATLCASGSSRGSQVFRARRQGPILDLPEGYMLCVGTSAAAPNVAGHIALLISAAKQARIPYDPARLRMALLSTARFLDGVEARVQGHGVVQVAQAWTALQQVRHHDLSTFRVEAPVKTRHSAQLATPHVGRGLYERIGWSPGQAASREITITRTTGPDRAITYSLRWKGDTAAFRLPRTRIVLPLNRPVRLPVRITVGESRAYSAILDLIDPAVSLAAHSVMCTVIVAERLTAANGHTATISGTAPRPGHGMAFVNVPAGTTALRIRVRQRGGRYVSLKAQMPDGQSPKTGAMSPDDGGASEWRLSPSDRDVYDHTFPSPLPGVWQFWLTHDDGSVPRSDEGLHSGTAMAAAFTMWFTAIGVDGTTESTRPHSVSIRFTNRLGSLASARAVALGMGSAREASPVLQGGLQPLFYDVDVPAETRLLEAEVDGATESDANVSLLAFYLDGGEASAVASDIGPGSRKRIVVRDPKPGRYKICLDAWGRVPPGGFTVRYRDTVFHPRYGQPALQDVAAELASDASRRIVASWMEPRVQPENGRHLAVQVGLVDEHYVAMEPDWRPTWPIEPPVSPGTSEPVPLTTQTIVINR